MLWKTYNAPDPLGVPLQELAALLQSSHLRSTVQGNVLIAQHGDQQTYIEVVRPEQADSEHGAIRAVVRILTTLPPALQDRPERQQPAAMARLNRLAGLGALHLDDGRLQVGSRLTLYENEDAWRTLQRPLLAQTILSAGAGLPEDLRRSVTPAEPSEAVSLWTESDLQLVERYLSSLCLCSGGGPGFTAEFGLTAGAISAMGGDQKTALFELKADQPHPTLGGGLLCLLQMPHQMPVSRLHQVCQQLNLLEMAATDLPPHFGAWCPGRLDNNPAYVSFLPNALHATHGVAVNFALWSMHRAHWAHAMLAALGVRV